LIDYYLKEFSTSHGKVVTAVTPPVCKVLMGYSWPGIVRETLKLTAGKREEAARLLTIGERNLYRTIKQYRIG
jgi:transcriptional regulator with PAS, ATPase and Fis domain